MTLSLQMKNINDEKNKNKILHWHKKLQLPWSSSDLITSRIFYWRSSPHFSFLILEVELKNLQLPLISLFISSCRHCCCWTIWFERASIPCCGFFKSLSILSWAGISSCTLLFTFWRGHSIYSHVEVEPWLDSIRQDWVYDGLNEPVKYPKYKGDYDTRNAHHFYQKSGKRKREKV